MRRDPVRNFVSVAVVSVVAAVSIRMWHQAKEADDQPAAQPSTKASGRSAAKQPLVNPRIVQSGTDSPAIRAFLRSHYGPSMSPPAIAAWARYRADHGWSSVLDPMSFSWPTLVDDRGRDWKTVAFLDKNDLVVIAPQGYDVVPTKLQLRLTQESGINLPLPFPQLPAPKKVAPPKPILINAPVRITPVQMAPGPGRSTSPVFDITGPVDADRRVTVEPVCSTFAESIAHYGLIEVQSATKPTKSYVDIDPPTHASTLYFRVVELQGRHQKRNFTVKAVRPIQKFGEDWIMGDLAKIQLAGGGRARIMGTDAVPLRLPKKRRQTIRLLFEAASAESDVAVRLLSPSRIGDAKLQLDYRSGRRHGSSVFSGDDKQVPPSGSSFDITVEIDETVYSPTRVYYVAVPLEPRQNLSGARS